LVDAHTELSDVEEHLEGEGIGGFKCYHCYSDRSDTQQSYIDEFLPEWTWKVADARGWFIMLHIVRDPALDDPENQRQIREKCERFPNAQLILAHAARGFHGPNTTKAIGSLRGLQNIWFDTAAICEAEPMIAILDEFGPRQLLYGSDFPVSHQRGRHMTLGSGFAWITTDQLDWNEQAFFGQPIQVGLEELRAIFQAADRFGLNDLDLQDIFCDNAERLLGLREVDPQLGQKSYEHALTIIPRGNHLLSKNPDRFAPDVWPPYFREARGCEVWDEAGRHFFDCSSHAVGATILGYRDPDVTRAVVRRVSLGSCCQLNPREEIELAELMCGLHPWAERVRLARTGGETMTVAVRIARATTDRSVVAVSGYHGWHDWYLAANLGEEEALAGNLMPGLEPLGVPRELRGTAHVFEQGDASGFDRIIAEYGDRLAAVVMEPCRGKDPEPGYLEHIRDEAHRVGALLIFDETSIGFRLATAGSHALFGVNPDIAAFGKSLGNGHPIGAVIGTAPAMEGAERSFISSSYWTEGVGPAAAVAAVKKMTQQLDVPAFVAKVGNRVKEDWRKYSEAAGIPMVVSDNYPCFASASFDHEQGRELSNLYTHLMLERGFLAPPSIYCSMAHTEEVLNKHAVAMEQVMAELADAIRKGDIVDRMRGPLPEEGFKRLVR
jgi:glutamate-1-semialdehyde 2,1-aminomutase